MKTEVKDPKEIAVFVVVELNVEEMEEVIAHKIVFNQANKGEQ
jgi:hypothetical protein